MQMKKLIYLILLSIPSLLLAQAGNNNHVGINPAYSCPQTCDAMSNTPMAATYPVNWVINGIERLNSGAVSNAYTGTATSNTDLETQIAGVLSNHSDGSWTVDVTGVTSVTTLDAMQEDAIDPVFKFAISLNGTVTNVSFSTNCSFKDPDCSTKNEYQYHYLVGDSLYLSRGGGAVDLSAFNSSISNTIVGNTIATHTAGGVSQDIDETITSLGTPIVDVTDPQNPVITLPYNQEGGTTQDVDITIPIPEDEPDFVQYATNNTPPTAANGIAENINSASFIELKAKYRRIKMSTSAIGTATKSRDLAFCKFSN